MAGLLRVATALALLVPGLAAAHVKLVDPPPRFPEGPPSSATGDQKTRPCGSGPATRKVTHVLAGETVNVVWEETIEHPSHFRISFDPTGKDNFPDPKSFTDTYTSKNVLLDGLMATAGKTKYSASVIIPKTPCSKCSLQLIQVMTDKPPYGDGNDIYYHCADMVVEAPEGTGGSGGAGGAGGSGGSGGDGGTGGTGDAQAPAQHEGGGCSSAPGSLLGVIALGLLVRRRRVAT